MSETTPDVDAVLDDASHPVVETALEPIPDVHALANMHCAPTVKALNAGWLEAVVKATFPDWAIINSCVLERTFTFQNYHQTLGFVNSIASMIHREDHHPELVVTYNRCVVRWDTHTIKGISLNDLICAAKCNLIAA